MKAGQARPQADILDAQVKQRQQDGHGLLFVPGADDGQGQVVDPHPEGVGQGHGDLHRGVGIVALAHVQEPGDAADIAHFLVKEAELAAGQGQDHAILGHLLHELGVVVAGGLGPVAAAHQEEVADAACS